MSQYDSAPTPQWATRLLCDRIMPGQFKGKSVWEPAAGAGHMADILWDYFYTVYASDVIGGHNFLRGTQCPFKPNWIITNPPHSLAVPFLGRALLEASEGAGIICNMDRPGIFDDPRLYCVAPFARSADVTYAWFVWLQGHSGGYKTLMVNSIV